MISNREIYSIQKDIESIKNTEIECSASIPNELMVMASMWVLNTETNLYEYVFTHNCGMSKKDLVIKFYDKNESILLSYRFVDDNNITIFSDRAFLLTIVIHAKNSPKTYSRNSQMDNYYTKEEVYNKEETYSIAEAYSTDEVYKKSEIYSKNDIYTKEETYSTSELYTKDEMLSKEQVEKEIDNSNNKTDEIKYVASEYMKYDTMYGNYDLSGNHIYPESFYTSEHSNMFVDGPYWLVCDQNINLSGLCCGSHSHFPKVENDGRCFGIYAASSSSPSKWVFAEINSNYDVINTCEFKSDIEEFGEVNNLHQIVTDTAYYVRDNKAYIVNGAIRRVDLGQAPWAEYVGYIRGMTIDLDTFTIEKSWRENFDATHTNDYNMNNFIEIIVCNNSITVFTSMFDGETITDTAYLPPGIAILTMSSDGALVSSKRLGKRIHKSHSIVFHEGYWYFFYSAYINDDDSKSVLFLDIFRENTSGNLELLDTREVYNIPNAEALSGTRISHRCFNYYMLNDDNTPREDGVGLRVVYYGGNNDYSEYILNITYNYSSDNLKLDIVPCGFANEYSQNFYSLGHFGMYYTGVKGKYVSLMCRHKSADYSPTYMMLKQTVEDGRFVNGPQYYDGIIDEKDVVRESNAMGPEAIGCTFKDSSYIVFKGNGTRHDGVMIRPGYIANENQRLYWRENEKALYLNKKGKFEPIIFESEEEFKSFATKNEVALKSNYSHNHDHNHCTSSYVNEKVTELIALKEALKVKKETLSARVTALEGGV